MSSSKLHVVIGSGPAGVACARGLLARGARVLMLDGGVSLEPHRASLVGRLRQRPFAEWEASALATLKEGTSAGTKGIPLKRLFGSDFPYRECEAHMPASYNGVAVRPSLAPGGLSNVWGAAMMPYREADLRGWPLGEKDLAPHYAAVLDFTGLSARQDSLQEFFPLYSKNSPALKLSNQATRFSTKLSQHEDELADAGIQFGQARVAVRVAEGAGDGCVYCGMCMYGCVYGHIYNAADTVREMRSGKLFEYRPGIVVTRLEESGASATVHGFQRETGENVSMTAARVYLAGGALPSTRILLKSQSLFGQTVRMQDSQYFLFPLLQFEGERDVQTEALHTLSQLFLEIFDSDISPYTVHIQVYTYNDLIGQAVRGAMRPFGGLLGFLARGLERRLLIMQGYLHSEHSAKIALTLRENGTLEATAEVNPETKSKVRRVLKKLTRHRRAFAGVPLSAMLQIAEPGRGFHTGGTFPMSRTPSQWQTDLLGRPFGWQRVHVVDSTVLPSIPATTITFSVMANAHRIATESAEVD